MVYLLDTHVVCWSALEADRLSTQVKSILESLGPQDQLAVADITLWEIAMLICKQRLIINIPLQQWIEQCIVNLKLQIIPLSAEIVADSVQLPNNFHSDPADQLIVATARCIKATLLTRDQKYWIGQSQGSFTRLLLDQIESTGLWINDDKRFLIMPSCIT